jgi:hypothetical protein
MARYLIRKILVVLIIILPVFYWTGCKKQPKCGCGKDILRTDTLLVDLTSIKYNDAGTIAYYIKTNAIGYDTYYFCNPVEMYPAYTAIKGENQAILSGYVYYDCQWLMNSSSGSSYMYYYYKTYNIQVTGLKSWGYGKK